MALNQLTSAMSVQVTKDTQNSNNAYLENEIQTDIAVVQTQISNIGNASPKGVYTTTTALTTAFPTGNTNIYVVTADGKWYYWNGSVWTAGGTYQSTGIANGSVTKAMLETLLQNKIINQLVNNYYMYGGINHSLDVLVNANTLQFTTNTTYGAAGFAVPNMNGHKYKFITTVKNIGAVTANTMQRLIGFNNSPSATANASVNGSSLVSVFSLAVNEQETYIDEFISSDSTHSAIALQILTATNGAVLQITQNIYDITNIDSNLDASINWLTISPYSFVADSLSSTASLPNGIVKVSNFETDFANKIITLNQLVNTSYMHNGTADGSTVVDNSNTDEILTNTAYGTFGFHVSNVNGHVYKSVTTVTNLGSTTASVNTMSAYGNYNSNQNGNVTLNGINLSASQSIIAGASYTFTDQFTSNQSAYSRTAVCIFTALNGAHLKVSQNTYDITGLTALQISMLNWLNVSHYSIISDSSLNVLSKWYGKTWVVLGDSIMQHNNIQPIVQSALGFGTVVNLAISGQAVATMADNLTLAQAQAADIITLYGCLNDFVPNGSPLGTINDTPNKTGSTFLSRLKYTIETILTLVPTAFLVIIGTHNAADAYRPPIYGYINGTQGIVDYVAGMQQVAQHYGLPFIDMFGKSGFNAFSLTAYTGSDGAHPNSVGAAKIASILVDEFTKVQPLS